MVKLFTHTDLDGVGCAILAKLAFKEKVDIEYCDYDDINKRVLNYLSEEDSNLSEIYITDISVNKEVAQLLNDRGNVCLLDHHLTALELSKYNWCEIRIEDSNRVKTSGTKMFYHWLGMNGCFDEELENNIALKKFVELVRNYDTWIWSELGEEGVICKKINDLFHLYGKNMFIDWIITQIQWNTFPKLSPSDELVLNIEQKKINDYIAEKNKQLFISSLCEKSCGVVFAEKYFSELGNKICQMHPEIDFVAMIDLGKGIVSYRTIKDDIHLGKDIAQKFGGGGHAKSAGNKIPKEKIYIIENFFS